LFKFFLFVLYPCPPPTVFEPPSIQDKINIIRVLCACHQVWRKKKDEIRKDKTKKNETKKQIRLNFWKS
jgi:hypothetical protein